MSVSEGLLWAVPGCGYPSTMGSTDLLQICLCHHSRWRNCRVLLCFQAAVLLQWEGTCHGLILTGRQSIPQPRQNDVGPRTQTVKPVPFRQSPVVVYRVQRTGSEPQKELISCVCSIPAPPGLLYITHTKYPFECRNVFPHSASESSGKDL